jgi:hypothetical protein
MKCYLALALSFLIVFSGCATYRPLINVSKIEVKPFWRTEGLVTIGVDPYIQTDRQKEVFDDDLEKAGVLPIYLLVKNNSDQSMSLRHEDIVLEYPSGYKISLVQIDTVLRILDRKNDYRPSIPIIVLGAIGLGGFYLLVPFVFAGAIIEKKIVETKVAETDYKEKVFKDVKLNKDESIQGFVFFMPPSSGLEAVKGKLNLHFVNETDGTSFVVQVPLGEL